MIELELNCDTFDEVRSKCIELGLIEDAAENWVSDPAPFTVAGVTFKQWKYVPTPEQLARREEFKKTPFGQLIERSADSVAAQTLLALSTPNVFLTNTDHQFEDQFGIEGAKIGAQLRRAVP